MLKSGPHIPNSYKSQSSIPGLLNTKTSILFPAPFLRVKFEEQSLKVEI